jgi:hypothetical protein
VKQISSESELAHIAYALLGKQKIAPAERRLLKPLAVADSLVVKAVSELIRAGQDPLGDYLLALRSPESRRTVGAVYTPAAIVTAMVGWAASKGSPTRIVDPGCGSGRFTVAAAAAFPEARLVAYSQRLPERFLVPSITKAKELFSTNGVLTDARSLRRVIDLPADCSDLSGAERIAVEAFKLWARKQGAHQTYTARAKRAWWSIGLREPAPILCTYMARKAPAFVRNLAGARHINIAHGLYPRVQMTDVELDAYAKYLRENVCQSEGRTYAGGLTKFEPKEIERILVPCLDQVRGRPDTVDASRACRGREGVQGEIPQGAH